MHIYYTLKKSRSISNYIDGLLSILIVFHVYKCYVVKIHNIHYEKVKIADFFYYLKVDSLYQVSATEF